MQVKAVFFGEPRMLLFLEHVVLFQVLHVPLFFSKFVPRNDPTVGPGRQKPLENNFDFLCVIF
jgi:hypothetical protein